MGFHYSTHSFHKHLLSRLPALKIIKVHTLSPIYYVRQHPQSHLDVAMLLLTIGLLILCFSHT